MCKFHKEVSRAVATDPATGVLNPAHEAVIRVAFSRYWQERYVEGAETVDGYSPYPMATLAQQAAFERSGLKKSPDVVEREMRDGVQFLRAHLALLEQERGPLNIEQLGLPIKTARDAFIDKAILTFYQGDPKGDFRFIERTDDPALAPLHRAVAFFQTDEESQKVLERMVTGRICALYTAAPHQVNQKVMNAYERLPERAKNFLHQVAGYGGNILMGGFSGIAGHGVHYGAVLGAGAASGMASSMNYALSGVFLAASYGVWDRVFGGRYRSFPEKRNAFIVQAVLTTVVAVAGQLLLGHDNHADQNHHGGHQHSVAADISKRVADLKQSATPGERARWESAAKSAGLTLDDYLGQVCVTPEALPNALKGGLKPVHKPE